jgi:glycosyltransferase involved in cell wall biosynthesis
VRPLALLHVIANRWWTGSADPALALALGLRARGHDVAFACIPGDALEARARAAGLPPVPGIRFERTARPWALARDVGALRRLVRVRRIDVVHAHLTHDHWLAALAVRGTGAALVRSVHHRRAVHRGPAARWLFRRTAHVLVASEGIAAAIRAAGLPAERLAVIPGAADTARFRPDVDGRAARAALGLGSGPVVGCVARLVPGRGHDVLLEAVGRLRARRPDVRLLLVGRGEGRPAIERRVHDLALEAAVVFAGYRGDDLPEVVAAMDCFVLLGGGSEESGRAVLEAMAAGRPVVAGRFGAMPETVIDGETGWLVDGPADGLAEVVAARVGALLADPARAQAMGHAARQRVTAQFSPERRVALAEAAYRVVLAADAGAATPA